MEGFFTLRLNFIRAPYSTYRLESNTSGFRGRVRPVLWLCGARWVDTAEGAQLTNSNSLFDERGWPIPLFSLLLHVLYLSAALWVMTDLKLNGTRSKPSTGRLTAIGARKKKGQPKPSGLINKTQTYLERTVESCHYQSCSPKMAKQT